MRNMAFMLACCAGLLAASFSPVFADKRVALVIGNSAYQNVQHLANPVNDAADMAATLKGLGFQVTSASDLGRVDMQEQLANFSDRAVGADIALVFFAGHGMELDRRNYLIPVDAKLANDRRLRFEAVSLDDVMAALEGVKGIRIVLLDACRNNPFAASMKVSTASRSVGRGLLRVEASKGTLISFSAKEGTVAADGSGRNSPYTAALLKNLKEPGLEISLLFRKVRDNVLEATGMAQEPFVSASLSSDEIYLLPPVTKSETPPQPLPRPEADPAAEVWAVTKDTESPEVLKTFIARFKGTVYAELAGARLKEIEANRGQKNGFTVRTGRACTVI